ncbi:hypothetical protein CF54_14840 [Streptomyces sp. Tu 6176]|nr:hypothetical protein CF54_14840 [Streptomyces sp. Tu 6176]
MTICPLSIVTGAPPHEIFQVTLTRCGASTRLSPTYFDSEFSMPVDRVTVSPRNTCPLNGWPVPMSSRARPRVEPSGPRTRKSSGTARTMGRVAAAATLEPALACFGVFGTCGLKAGFCSLFPAVPPRSRRTALALSSRTCFRRSATDIAFCAGAGLGAPFARAVLGA